VNNLNNRQIVFLLSVLLSCFITYGNAQNSMGFIDSYVTKLTPWIVTEHSPTFPDSNYPAFIGSGLIGIGTDVSGMQGLTDELPSRYHLFAAPFQMTQSNLYVLHQGMISEHLYQDEVKSTGIKVDSTLYVYGQQKNYMPLGYLTQSFTIGDSTFSDNGILKLGRDWTRTWDLKNAIVRNSFIIQPDCRDNSKKYLVETEMFSPIGGETVYIKLVRHSPRWRKNNSPQEKFKWTVSLPLKTRHGLPLFDEEGAVQKGKHTIKASITKKSRYVPSEDYTILYGIGTSGMHVEITNEGWNASSDVPVSDEQTCYLRLDFRRFTTEKPAYIASQQNEMEKKCIMFSPVDYENAKAEHIRKYEQFWGNTANIEVEQPDLFEVKRQFMLHMSEYLFYSGNNFDYGGNVQFLLFHQNGWGASNFHDMQYMVDGIARVNMWNSAEDYLRWMYRVMQPKGRAFPWMMTYDGKPTVTAERDRAPMSDANRAMTAVRIYELAGKGRDSLLRKYVYPIVSRVANLGIDNWFYEHDGRLLFKGIETDVTGDNAVINDAANVTAYNTLIRKAIEYSKILNIDQKQRQIWSEKLPLIYLDTIDNRYSPRLNATAQNHGDLWFGNIFYTAEAKEFLDEKIYTRTRDYGQQHIYNNIPWLGFAAASSELRLNRPDRAEQFFVDILENRIHGPGYFEEMSPVGYSALPPFASAHGSHLVAACEQIVMSDFWIHKIFIATGMPSKLRMSCVKFSNLRARDGLIVSGNSTPRSLTANLYYTGEPLEMVVVLEIPSEVGQFFKVLVDGKESKYIFHGESIELTVKLEFDQKMEINIEG